MLITNVFEKKINFGILRFSLFFKKNPDKHRFFKNPALQPWISSFFYIALRRIAAGIVTRMASAACPTLAVGCQPTVVTVDALSPVCVGKFYDLFN
jgi:hypothetical protein